MLNDAMHVLNSRKSDLDMIMSDLESKTVETVAITKASIIMMAYNMVEGVFFTLLQEVFDFLKDSSKGIGELTKELQLDILNYHFRVKPERLIEFIEAGKIEIPAFTDYVKILPIFSGNLDSKSIRELSGKFGVSFKNSKWKSNDKRFSALLYIKETRNKLAHGEISYSQACRDKTLEELHEYIDKAYEYIKQLIGSFEKVYPK